MFADPDEHRIGMAPTVAARIGAAVRYGGLCVLAVWAAVAVAAPAPSPPVPAASATAAPTAAAVSTATEETKCGLLVDTPDGMGKLEPKDDLHPLSQTGPGKSFTVDAAPEAGVMCGRTSIVPMPYDIQVTMTGHAFYIFDKPSGRIGVLEINEGRCEYRMLKGALTADEETLLQPRLDDMQKIAAGVTP